MHYYYFEVIKGIERGKRYPVDEGAISIGRSSSNTIAIHPNEKGVSGHHAIMYRSSDALVLQDLESTNGTFINEEKIKEKEIKANDVLGFGKTGPRIKLIQSPSEISIEDGSSSFYTAPSQTKNHDDTKGQHRKAPTNSTVDSTARASNIVKTMKNTGSSNRTPEGDSATLIVEQKLLRNQMKGTDIHNLMKKGERLDKIISRGNLDDAQASLLVSTFRAGKKSTKQWVYIVSGILSISFIVILFLGIRIVQYKQKLSMGLSLEEKLDLYEKQIFQANSNPDFNKKKLGEMILELEETKKRLKILKSQLKNDDQEKFYTDETEKMIDEIMIHFGETDYHIPPKMIERVNYHISIYSGRMKRGISKYLQRKKIYFPMIIEIFTAKRLPIDLAYISMLESGFNPKALSHAGARGLWQFMPKTGRSYGLIINKTVDERCDPQKATYAAAEYFKDLIGIFGGKSSVMLAMAAYNAGEGRIMGALRKIDDPMRNRDFWYIYRMGCLAEETNEYIPRVLALMIIDKHPEKYGFKPDGSIMK